MFKKGFSLHAIHGETVEYIDNIPEQIPGIDKLFGCDKNGRGPENRPLFHRSKGEN